MLTLAGVRCPGMLENLCSYLSLTCNSRVHVTECLEPGPHQISVELRHLDPISSSKTLHQ